MAIGTVFVAPFIWVPAGRAVARGAITASVREAEKALEEARRKVREREERIRLEREMR